MRPWGGVDGGRRKARWRSGFGLGAARWGRDGRCAAAERRERLALGLVEGGWKLNRKFGSPRCGEGAGLTKNLVSKISRVYVSTHVIIFSHHKNIFHFPSGKNDFSKHLPNYAIKSDPLLAKSTRTFINY